MKSLFYRFAKPSRRRGVRRREVFSAQFDSGQSAAALCTSIHLGCDVLERRIVLTASESDFVFSQGTITGYTGAGGVVEIPATIGGLPVAVIGEHAFEDKTTITSVAIPDSVVLICDYAFYHATSLTSVTIGNGVTHIGNNAFESIGFGLTSLTIGNHVTSIGDFAFAASGLKTLVIPNSVKTIGQHAFGGNNYLTTLTLGKGVQTIGKAAFHEAFALKSVSIPNSVTTVGEYAFADNRVLTQATIGTGVTGIGDYAFLNNANLKSVTMGSHVTSIGSGAFEGNTALKSMTFAAKAPAVGTDAFKGVPFGAKAIRAAGLSGYGPNGTLWNGLIVWTPGRVAPPTVTVSRALLAQNATTITIKGTGFVAGRPSAHQVNFNNGAEGTVTAATATQLTVMFTKQLPFTGPLTATVTSVGGTSGVAKQVATVKITYQRVKVGNPNNANDTGGSQIGAVAYSYQMGKYDVTIGQYAAFLNSVAKTDTYSLYHPSMATDANIAGIQQNGSSGSYTYSVIGSPNRPITWVCWFDAARFANWMTNGQGNGSTETGAYTLVDGQISGTAPAANPGAKFRLPTGSEFYKAAYYSPTLNSGAGGYYRYATQSNDTPGNTVGDGANQANYNNSGLTDVGAFSKSGSFYGTFDQSGNVFQWNDLDGTAGSLRGRRGGAWMNDPFGLSSSYSDSLDPAISDSSIGFRLVSPVGA